MKVCKLLLCAVIACALPGTAHAQTYPTRTITLVIPFAPGGSNTVVGRAIADKIGELLGEKIVIDNRPGAGGTVGTRAVAKSEPDGYTLLLSFTGTMAIAPSLYKNVGYDPRRDFAPIGMIGNAPNSLVVHPSFPAKTLAELVRLRQGQSRQGQFRLRRRRHRQPHHRRIFCGVRRDQAGAYSLQGHRARADRSLGRPHPDGVRADPGLARQCFGGIAARAGGDQHDPLRPAAGCADGCRIRLPRASLYYGLVAPAGTSRLIIDKLNKALQGALASDQVKKQLGLDGTEITPGTPEAYADHIDKDEKKWSALVRASGVEQE
jgi:tripartite-type tricarboxylate transporter receptor subunit TctC